MKREAEKSEMWLIRMRDWRWRSGIRGNDGGRKEKETNWRKSRIGERVVGVERNEGGKGIKWDPKAVARDDVVSWSSVDTDFEGWETESFSPPLGTRRNGKLKRWFG